MKNTHTKIFAYILGAHQLLGVLFALVYVVKVALSPDISIIDWLEHLYNILPFLSATNILVLILALLCLISCIFFTIITFISGFQIIEMKMYGRYTIISLMSQIPLIIINTFTYTCSSGLFNLIILLDIELTNDGLIFSQGLLAHICPIYYLGPSNISDYGFGLNIIPIVFLSYILSTKSKINLRPAKSITFLKRFYRAQE